MLVAPNGHSKGWSFDEVETSEQGLGTLLLVDEKPMLPFLLPPDSPDVEGRKGGAVCGDGRGRKS